MDLVKILRNAPSDKVRKIANRMATDPKPGYINELIRMASGRRKRWVSWYKHHHMIIGLEVLGQSCDPRALAFLENAYTKKQNGSGERITYTFPYAPRRLARLLAYSPGESEDPATSYAGYIPNRTVTTALRTLRSCLNP